MTSFKRAVIPEPLLALRVCAPVFAQKDSAGEWGNRFAENFLERIPGATNEVNGDSWPLLTSIVEDPQYLASDFWTSDHCKREADSSKWNPAPCRAR